MLDAHAHLSLLASKEENVNLGFCDGVAEQFYIAIAMSESGEYRNYFSCKPMKGKQLIGGFQRGMGQGVQTPPSPWKITKNRVLSILVRFPLKITKLPSQHSMLGHQSAKHHLNGVSLAGQWWPTYSGVWIFSLLSLRLCLHLTILADSLGPDLAHKMFNVFIDKTAVRSRFANSLLSYNKVGVHTSTDVW